MFNILKGCYMYESVLGILAIGLSGTLLTFARRFKNNSSHIGEGIVAWTIVVMILWIFGTV